MPSVVYRGDIQRPDYFVEMQEYLSLSGMLKKRFKSFISIIYSQTTFIDVIISDVGSYPGYEMSADALASCSVTLNALYTVLCRGSLAAIPCSAEYCK